MMEEARIRGDTNLLRLSRKGILSADPSNSKIKSLKEL
tara:strand:- start:1245 stop:1358 length:114 start_codon:yes stop_codon:yes gene_type:complete